MELPKTYDPSDTEERLYRWWEESGYFTADLNSSRPPFSMVLPPPNVTGSLHMGHALNITLQDILARWKRMEGFNVLWVPGTDHAGIATQNVVERNLAAQGKRRTDFSREEFERLVWEWKERSEARILSQIRRLGSSCDWTRKRFTMDEGLSRAVREVFVRLYEAGLIYRGEYLVNWCPRCRTAISDLEVEYEPTTGRLWYIRYPVLGSDDYVVVATTRPETMLGDTAVAVHPADERYRSLRGREILLPLMNRRIPVIFDTFVEREFGTGVVKVTPGHDPNDFEAGRRHRLPIIRVIGEDGRMTEEAGGYAGLDRYEARRRVVSDLQELGLLETIEEHRHNVGHCQRCATVVEPLVSKQWFVRVKPLAVPAVQAVQEGRTRFVPENFERIYFDWMNNIHDWCISRQLWWGHRIPAWYCGDCGEMIVARQDPAVCTRCGGDRLTQESDVLDTWFSSALWPFSTLGWPDETPEQDLFYPTSALVTGFDIIFFWVARMMMMGLHFKGDVPFRKVFINGLVRDEHGRKMSKSKGNVIDPLEIIEQYGTDAVRFTLAVMAVPGSDLPFSISRMAGYRAFCNKIWNAARFLLMNLQSSEAVEAGDIEAYLAEPDLELHHRWMLSRLQSVIEETRKGLDRFFVHEASNGLYHFFWGEFCDWYLELIKDDFQSEVPNLRRRAERIALYVLDVLLRLLHPFIPFITEEIWQRIPHQGETIMLRAYPISCEQWKDSSAESSMALVQELITAIRTARAENGVDPRVKVPVYLRVDDSKRDLVQAEERRILRLVQADKLVVDAVLPTEGVMLQGVTPLAEFAVPLEEFVDVAAEQKRLEKELNRVAGELQGVEKKLANEDFRGKAPVEVVARAEARREELRDLHRRLQERLAFLNTVHR
ncbi:MAG TPA: valine--tRNA ligase [Acidobacteriota bacterium]|nr:valine--tRNA ligase [Acidobacteriota bacterium]HRR56235.1 valine--tRNA ligase [Acidobacteriota bacterium]